MSIEQIPNGGDEKMRVENVKSDEELETIESEDGNEQIAFEVGQLVKAKKGGKLYINSIDVEKGRAFLSNLEPGQEGARFAAEDISLAELAELQKENVGTESKPDKKTVETQKETVAVENEKTKKAKLTAASLHNLFGQFIGEYTITEDMTTAEEDITKMLEMIGESFPDDPGKQLELLSRLREEQENGTLTKRFEEVL
ncbi:MAG: hypothetical protein KGZ30_03585 [Anaplasmataceae bacterium]|nr:hypothetical protein [Anaplasmataceae bacterium]